MSKIEDGGPALPFCVEGQTTAPEFYYGISQRDYFAIHASEEDLRAQAEEIRHELERKFGGIGILPDNWRVTARYMHADAMLKAREQS